MASSTESPITPVSDTIADLDLAFFELAPRLVRLEDSLLRELDPPLTFRQYRLLRRVAEGYQTLTTIFRRGTLSMPALSEGIETLVGKGLIAREPNAADRRSTCLVLTTKGRRVIAQADAKLGVLAVAVFDVIPEERRTEFKSDLAVLGERVRELMRAQYKSIDGE